MLYCAVLLSKVKVYLNFYKLSFSPGTVRDPPAKSPTLIPMEKPK